MTLQSSMFDPVVGLDVHLVAMPTPAGPVPMMVPMPFVGLVFDPAGLAIGVAISLACNGAQQPGLVLVNGMFVTNCGTNVTNALTLPHLPTPGIAFLPSAVPVKFGDAELLCGSRDVQLGGAFGVRLGEQAMSCSDPMRMPTSFVIAIPKGFPVLNNAPSAPDLATVGMQIAIRGSLHLLGALAQRVARAGGRLFRTGRRGSRFWRATSTALGGCQPHATASRGRRAFARVVRFVTGHPIDVVSGNLFTDVVDVRLPGPLPLTIERVYESAGSARAGVLGHGWSHTLDEALFFERGRAVYRAGDGRELELTLYDLPGRRLAVGDVVERARDRLRLRAVAEGRYEIEHEDGRVHELALVRGGDAAIAKLVRIRSEDGHHAIELSYDERGLLERVRDSGGRHLYFEHDETGRLVRIKLPVPHGRGWVTHRQYQYDEQGDLVRVVDATGASYRYAYCNHLLIAETDRTGASFYFQYDGVSESARCVRTWGDGAIYDHVVDYDIANRRTFVRDSLNAPKLYEHDARGLVTRIVDAEGRTTRFEYDAGSLAESALIAPDGSRQERAYDEHGNLIRTLVAGQATTISYEGRRPLRLLDAHGGQWSWRYDVEGHVVEHASPAGERTRIEWDRGLVRAVDEPGQGRITIEYDEQREVRAVVLGPEALVRCEHDQLGRTIKVTSPRGAATRTHYDAEGRPIACWSLAGVASRAKYDAEGHVLELQSGARHERLAYGPGHRVVEREQAGTRVRYERDTECRLLAIVNEAGERYAFALDRVGDVREEVAFDGARRLFQRDVCGRVTKVFHASGRTTEHAYDSAGRLARVAHSDGAFARFEYDAHGDLAAAENESSRVELEHDAAGRVVRERANGHEVRSEHTLGTRAIVTTSLGARVACLPDAAGRVAEMFFGDDPRPAVTFERDALGAERARRFANGIEQSWTRDTAGRPQVRRTLARFTGMAGIAAAAALLAGPSLGAAAPMRDAASTEYAWAGDDEITRLVDSASGIHTFDRDARGRLVRETRDERETLRALDATGNISRSPTGADREYGAGGRLHRREGTRIEHDADGNRVREIDADGASWEYLWNGHGLLREVRRPDGRRVGFEYDAFARRTAKRTIEPDGRVAHEVRFVWDGTTLVHEDDSGLGLTTWHHGPDDGALVARERNGQTWFVTTDHLGTPTEMYDARGELAWRQRLDTWGAADVTVGTADDCAWRWPGQYEDAETGLYYNRHRYYAPDDGRYISQDPIRLDGGMVLYGYVEDPTGWIDPDGLAPIPLTRRGYMVYHIVRRRGDRVVYVGITNNEDVRRAAHADSGRLTGDYRLVQAPGTDSDLMYGQARGIEQADIRHFKTRHTDRIGEPIAPGDGNRVWSYAESRRGARPDFYREFDHRRGRQRLRGGC